MNNDLKKKKKKGENELVMKSFFVFVHFVEDFWKHSSML